MQLETEVWEDEALVISQFSPAKNVSIKLNYDRRIEEWNGRASACNFPGSLV